ncbi:hypothetical protein CPB84DRAFT_1762325 [Gymnopilus junonius]|uniref:Uncharacterized protein n=1 Tax=Gymnopilus junonius TaxID=109634 RepID=A0A9P5TUK2_GYMJU|nr:hypothetical protein CPB84DRAFT_1762325 [Gymnopilus junonius]
MKFRPDRNVAEEEDDWEIIPANWWCTSFMAVSWSFTSKQDQRGKDQHFQGSLFVGLSSRLSSRFLSLNSLPSPSRTEGRIPEEGNDLNLELVGVKNAMDTVLGYEKDVGFYFTNFPDLGLYRKPRPDLSVVIEESELEAGKDRWKEVVEGLMNGPLDSDGSLESSLIGSYGDLELSTSTLSSVDLTRSEASVDSIPMPSTPKAKLPFTEVEIKEPSPGGPVDGSRNSSIQLSPSRSLNASASSFVPSFFSKLTEEPLQFPSLQDDPELQPDAHSPLGSLAHFTFPSLNSTPSSVVIKKDEQGFFTEVQVEKFSNEGSASDLLPPFLQEPYQRSRPRKSRTREIVDRIRSRASPEESSLDSHSRMSAISPRYASHSPSPTGDEGRFVTPRLSMSDDGGDRPSRLSTPSYVDDEDGWIDITQPPLSDSPSSQKSKRTRELFLALTRRRTDSSSSVDLKDVTASSEISSGSVSRHMSISPSPSPSPLSPPSLISTDGWIESSLVSSPLELQNKVKAGQTHNRKKSSNNNGNQQHRNQHQRHSSRTSVSSSASQRPFGATSPSYSQLSPTIVSPQHLQQHQQLIAPNAVAPLPYFFPPYPTVALPSPYATAFMQVPTFPLVHAQGGAMAGIPYMTPTLMPLRGVGVKSSMSTTNTAPMHMPKHSPMW